MRSALAAIAVSLLSANVYAIATVAIDVLDDPSEGTLPPPGIVVLDLLVDVSSEDCWTAGGVSGLAVNGASLRYAFDPNTGQPALTRPGLADRHVTFFSKPRPRDGNNRFLNSGAESAGRYCPSGPGAIASPVEINVAYYASPPETAGSPSVDGAVFRIALNLAAPGPFAIRPLEEVLPTDQVFFISHCDGAAFGTAVASYDVPMITGFDWALVSPIPEPTGLGFLASAALVLGWPRRR